MVPLLLNKLSKVGGTKASLLPKFLRVANQATVLAPTTVCLVLKAMGESVGPGLDGKRASKCSMTQKRSKRASK
jgi:hypothetical protein